MLADLIKPELIAAELKSGDKKALIREMAQLFVGAGIVGDLEEFIKGINQREEIESTAIGDGIAIPHARAETVKQLAIAFGGSKKGIDFKSLDGKPVHLVFMIAAPSDARKEYLQAVARIARLLKVKTLKQRLLEAETKEDVLRVIEDCDTKFPKRIEVETKKGRVVYQQ